MILIFVLAAVAGLIAYFVTVRLNRVARAVIAALVFLAPVVTLTAMVIISGDEPPPGGIVLRTIEPGNEVRR